MKSIPLKFPISATFWLFLVICLSNCESKKTELVWTKDLFQIGSQSSPRVTDLNNDGVMDIVIGAGKNEYQHSEQGIIALNGSSGEILWQQETDDQVYGSPTFYDVNQDSIADVFIGGRSPHLKALDGKTGTVIWEYNYQYNADTILRNARFNFQNGVLIPDQNNDGFKELMIVNGGNAKAAPNTEEDRYPGVLMVFDSKTGGILAADTMPDGKEAYMPAVCFRQPETEDPFIIFGTGGETISGNLYMIRLSDLMRRELSKSIVIASESGHGFIAPPVIADINKDGWYDIIAISHASTVFAIDGKTQELIWRNKIENTECSNSFAAGYFTADDIPDFFTFVSKGAWPNNTGSIQVMFDGKTGDIAYQNELGCTGFSSPVAYDLNHDGIEEAIISINEFDCERGFTERTPLTIENKLVAINFSDKSVNPIDQMAGFKNIFTTPWIGDLDGDGYLDIIHCQYFSHSADLLSFLGMKMKRISTSVKLKKTVKWGGYMGSTGDAIFRMEENDPMW